MPQYLWKLGTIRVGIWRYNACFYPISASAAAAANRPSIQMYASPGCWCRAAASWYLNTRLMPRCRGQTPPYTNITFCRTEPRAVAGIRWRTSKNIMDQYFINKEILQITSSINHINEQNIHQEMHSISPLFPVALSTSAFLL